MERVNIMKLRRVFVLLVIMLPLMVRAEAIEASI